MLQTVLCQAGMPRDIAKRHARDFASAGATTTRHARDICVVGLGLALKQRDVPVRMRHYCANHVWCIGCHRCDPLDELAQPRACDHCLNAACLPRVAAPTGRQSPDRDVSKRNKRRHC